MCKMMTSLGGNSGALLAGAGMVVALALGAYLGFGRENASLAPTEVSTPGTGGQDATAPDASAALDVDTSQDTAATPSFDTLRRDPDGTTIIAGRAAPLSDVKILLDGAEVATAKADSTGGFAAIATLPPKDMGQIVSLSATSGEEVSASVDEVLLAPSVAQPEIPATAAPTEEVATSAPVAEAAAKVAETKPDEVTDAQAPRVAVLKSDADGVSLMSPEVASEVALDTIGYSEGGEVQLTGRARPDTAKVRVYLDNQSIISLPVDTQGRWRGDLPDVDEGVYTLRVDEVSAQGTVSSRVETPFKRESPSVLAQAATNGDGPIKSITVQTGATLWAIARDRYGDGTLYLRVVEANSDSIRNPDLIYPGQVFDLPN